MNKIVRNNIYRSIFVILFVIVFQLFSNAQNDSLSLYVPKVKPAKFVLEFDARHSFVLGQRAKMNGFKLGVELFERYRMGIGYYYMNNPVSVQTQFIDGIPYDVNLKLNYTTLFTEYVFYKDFKFTASAVASAGFGKGELHLSNKFLSKDSIQSTPSVPVFATNVSLFYHPIPWVGIGGGVGMRRVLVGDEKFKKVFNSPVYIIKIKVILGALYKSIFKRKTIKAARAQYKKERAARIERRKERKLAKLNSNGSVLRD